MLNLLETKISNYTIMLLAASLYFPACGNDDLPAGESDADADGDADTDADGDADTDADSDTGPAEVWTTCDKVVEDGLIYMTEDVNYAFTSSLFIQDITVRSAYDLTFQWGALTEDMFHRPLNPLADIEMILVTLWNMTPAVLTENLRLDRVGLSENRGAAATFPGGAYTQMNYMNFVSPDGSTIPADELWSRIDTTDPAYPFRQDEYTFMVSASHSTDPKKDNRMVQFFHIDPNAQPTSVALTNNSMSLTYSTNLVTTMPVAVRPFMPHLVIDWSYMLTNALGNEFFLTKITEAMVAHYPNLTRKNLDDQFINLRELTTEKWSGTIQSGLSVDLSTLVDGNGAPTFGGIDSTGVWLAALFCSSCSNPAPWAIAVLQACP